MSDYGFGIQKCGECRYAKVENPLMKNSPTQCRRHPPQVVLIPMQGPQGVGISLQAAWPSTQRTDGCGDGLPAMGTVTVVGESSPVRFSPPDSVNGGDA